MNQPLSVTVLADATGSDPSALLNRVLQSSNDLHVTAIVPKHLRKQIEDQPRVVVVSTQNRLARPGQVCACCTVRSDLMHKIRQIVAKKRTEHIVIQAAPDADLEILAKTFTVTNKKGATLSEVAHLESIVLVVNARNLLSTLKTKVGRHMVERVELANVIVLKSVNILASEAYSHVARVLTAINPEIQIIRGDQDDKLTLSSLRTERPYDLQSTQLRAQELDTVDRTDPANAIVQFTYYDRRPFHPERLRDLMSEPWTGVLRARGTFWVASRPDYACTLNIAGGSRRTSSEEKWWSATPQEERSSDPEFLEYIEGIWDENFRDRYQKLTIVGVNIDEHDLRRHLDQCLLNDEELADPDTWHALPHPFPWPRSGKRKL